MQSSEQLIWIPINAFALCALLHIFALRLFPKWKLLDFPERYGHKRSRIPYPTGILGIATFIVIVATFLQPWDKQMIGIILGVILIGAVSFIDDRKQVSPWIRLSYQVLAAILIFLLGTRIFSITNPFVADGIIKLDAPFITSAIFNNPPILSGLFTLFWLGLTINALNWFDGIPGQVSLLSTIGFLTIGFLALSDRVVHVFPELQLQLALLAFVLAGISAASLLFDFPSNRVLMGDTGSMFFGLMLGVLTIYAGGKVATAFLVLGVPLIDSGIVIVRRLSKGVSPFQGNAKDEHLHHRLLAKGWSERKIIILTAALGSAFGITALFMSTHEKIAAALLLFLIMLGLSWYSKNNN